MFLFSSEEDRVDLRECVKLTREIFAQPAFDEFRGEEMRPGKHVSTKHIYYTIE